MGVNFSLSGCSTTSPETLMVSVDLGAAPAAGSVAYKIGADGVWTAIPGATIAGSVVTYSITDNDGVLDQDDDLGGIEDPITVAIPPSTATPAPVPTLSGLLLGLLTLLMSGLVWSGGGWLRCGNTPEARQQPSFFIGLCRELYCSAKRMVGASSE